MANPALIKAAVVLLSRQAHLESHRGGDRRRPDPLHSCHHRDPLSDALWNSQPQQRRGGTDLLWRHACPSPCPASTGTTSPRCSACFSSLDERHRRGGGDDGGRRQPGFQPDQGCFLCAQFRDCRICPCAGPKPGSLWTALWSTGTAPTPGTR